MSSRSFLYGAAALFATSAQVLFAQYTISLHSGLIQYTSGAVTVADAPVQKTTTNVLSLKQGQILATGADGVAEVLMTPGVFVRMVGDSSLRMDSISLADTRVTILTGSVMVECAELSKDNSVTFFVSSVPGSPSIEVRKKSLFRIDAQPAQVAVLDGEVFAAGTTLTKDRTLALSAAVMQPSKFKPNKQDDLYMFSEARSADSAYASNVVSSSMYNVGGTCSGSSWYLMNPVSMYAYLPCNGFAGMFGYPFYGVNYGYMYGGIPYYYAPPVLVVKPTVPVTQKPKTGVATSDRVVDAASVKSANGLMKVPAFVSVLNTKPTYLSVSSSSYLGKVSGVSAQSQSAGNGRTVGRYAGATSLPATRSGFTGGRAVASYAGGGNSGGGMHYSGGSTASAVSLSSGSLGGGHGSSGGGGGGHK